MKKRFTEEQIVAILQEAQRAHVLTPSILHSYAAKRNTSEGVLYCSAECFLSRL